ncbi:hypothetical protein H072_3565 [Dactylellina haptotyla CBS 200.50]|uniref:Transcription initiation factor IIE subunit beta n=1 Tax=Dactylellina haptotyla (strain CBS 200.50) TaxID=1284197 RepID=S8AHA6_DACHA|nr:hypothetical protein H072_3565 [Dactylellina haptotyla CBS 200.50]
MSLNAKLNSFKSGVMGQGNFAQARRHIPSPAPTQPSPASTPGGSGANGGSTSNPNSVTKKKKPVKNNIVYSQPADTGMGQYIMTQVLHLVEHLKEVEKPLTRLQLEDFLQKPLDSTMVEVLKGHDKLVYDHVSDSYAFKPLHNIRSAQQLLTHLQASTTAQGLSVKELKDGWSGALQTIDDLEASKDILVTRTKKDGQARMVWINDKSLNVNIDDEFKTIWEKIVIPPPAELPGELERAGLKPTSVDPATIKKAMQKDTSKKTKKPRRGRITNTHLAGMLRDYN